MASRLLLVRHADTAWQHTGRYLGKTDISLAPGAFERAAGLASILRQAGPTKCFSSPLKRAVETAQAATQGLQLSLQIDPDLREVDLGSWEGKTFAEISAGWGTWVSRWADLAEDFAFPGGESMVGFLQRVHAVADRLANDPADVVLAITHGGVIRMMICYLLGLNAKSYLLFEVKTASIAAIDLFHSHGSGAAPGVSTRGVLTALNLVPPPDAPAARPAKRKTAR